ncbi:MAG: K+-sensing histidine kinase KdpD [Rhodothermales bacterium]|jgi:K+-sensing histidine kinase KdpD
MGPERLTETDFLRRLRAELGRVYHDLSNPLAIVSGNLELVEELRNAGAPPEELMESISDAHSAVAGFTAPLKNLLLVRTLVEERLRATDTGDLKV